MAGTNSYSLADGRVVTRSLEAHIVDHCNLRCAACCSLSPHLPIWQVEPAALRQDLLLARAVLQPTYFKLVGGEPLLHPRLLECVEVAAEVRVAPILSLTTNGFLLEKMPDRLFEYLDHLTVSLYPKPALGEARLAAIRERCAAFGVELNLKVQDEFEEIHLSTPREDAAQTREIFAHCWLRRRCHLLRDGIFYTCTLPVHRDALHRDRRLVPGDGIALASRPGLAEEIRLYLEREQPLAACSACWGGSGPKLAHHQLGRGESEPHAASRMVMAE